MSSGWQRVRLWCSRWKPITKHLERHLNEVSTGFAPFLQPQWIMGNVSKGFWENFSLEAHLNGHHVWKYAGNFSIAVWRLCVPAPYQFIRIAGCVWAHFKPQDFLCIFNSPEKPPNTMPRPNCEKVGQHVKGEKLCFQCSFSFQQ